MGLATFIGGVHPFEGKELSQDRPIKLLAPEKGEEMVFPLSQHIGAPAKPLVQEGDRVLKGQIIAEPGGFISANVLSSVSGKVKKIEPRLVANGAMVNSIIVENDGEEAAIEHFGEDRDYTKLSKEEIVQMSRRIGTFDTSILPYEDCCTVFTPRHPRTRPTVAEVEKAESTLDVDALVAEALQGIERVTLDLEET